MSTYMATLSSSRWCPPAAAAAPRQRPPPASISFRQARRRRDASLRCRCHTRADDRHPEPEPSPGSSSPEAAASSGSIFARRLLRAQQALPAAMGMRDAPDLFLKEKDEICNYIMKISSSRADTLDVNGKVMALTVCAEVQAALHLASKVIDIPNTEALGLKAEISQDTTHLTIRAYTSIFCNVAKDAYHQRIKKETVLSFLDALRGLGAICHILAQYTVAKLDEGPLKDDITLHMETDSHDFGKAVNNMKHEVTRAAELKHTIVMEILSNGMKHAQSYVSKLIERHRDALIHLIIYSDRHTFCSD
ncbi:hypothetical protein ACP4OV_020802 [Aristida adscensionis]